MGLKLEKGLKHQSEAIKRINKVFENVDINDNTNKFANPLIDLNSSILIENIKGMNKDLPFSLKGKIGIDD